MPSSLPDIVRQKGTCAEFDQSYDALNGDDQPGTPAGYTGRGGEKLSAAALAL